MASSLAVPVIFAAGNTSDNFKIMDVSEASFFFFFFFIRFIFSIIIIIYFSPPQIKIHSVITLNSAYH